MEDNYNIDKYISDSLKEFSVKPAIPSFSETMQKLEQKKKRKRFFILLYSGLGSIAASLLFFYIFTSPVVVTNMKDLSIKETSLAPEAQTKEQDVTETKGHLTPQTTEAPIADKEKNTTQIEATNKTPKKSLQPNVPEQKQSSYTSLEFKKENSSENFKTVTPAFKNEQTQKTNPESNNPIVHNNTVSATETVVSTDHMENKEAPVINDNAFASQTLTPFFLDPVFPTSPTVFSEEVTTPPLNTQSLDGLNPLAQNNRRFRFMLGANFNPQFSRFLLTENKGRDAVYNTPTGKAISKEYLEDKKQMNKPYFSFAYGAKVGMAIQNDWEVWVGTGMQVIQFFERTYSTPIFSNTYTTQPTTIQNANKLDESKMRISYKYWYYSAEVKRNVQVHPFLRINFGVGVKMNHWYSVKLTGKSKWGNNNYAMSTEPLNNLAKWFCTIEARSGVIYDLGKRWQFRLTPGVFYSPTSIFNKHYVINQKSYGLELESMLVFKM